MIAVGCFPSKRVFERLEAVGKNVYGLMVE
jgi:hypothetical protein